MLTRRHFFFGAAFAAAVPAGGYASAPSLKRLGYRSPNETLNIASIGAGGRPLKVLADLDRENIVALADVDWERGAPGFEKYPQAKRYVDFRKMLDEMGSDIDAVLVGVPDHMHAPCALAAMQRGKHVYCEKPLTHTSAEARLLERAAEKYDVATQMGNQGYSHDATRVACEILWSGEIGEVTEVHAWIRPASWPQGMGRIPPPTPVPETLDWNLWLGGAEWREFTAGDEEYREYVLRRAARYDRDAKLQFGFYLPFNWRGFYDFGSGLIGDWGIHILGPANWGLQLSPQSLESVECIAKDSLPPYTFPDNLILKYEFGARGSMPPVTVYWHNLEGDAYLPPGMTAAEAQKIPGEGPQVGPPSRNRRTPPPDRSGYNCIFVGSKGYLGTSGRGEGVGLLPGSRWAEYELPPAYLMRAPGADRGSNGTAHAHDWIRACKGGRPASSRFEIAAPFTEWLVAGAPAVRHEGKLEWDGEKGEFMNSAEANRLLRPRYRAGWELS